MASGEPSPALEPSATSGLESTMLLGPWIRVRLAAGLCAPGGRVPRPGYLGDPRSYSPGFAKVNEGASWAMLCAPLPLFQPEGADEEARGALGMGRGGRLLERSPKSFRRPEPPWCGDCCS